MMKKISLFILVLTLPFLNYSQSVSVNTDGSSPDPSAILDVKSTAKGFLLPRMTTSQRTAIANPANGLQVFDTDTKTFWFYNGNAWTESATGSPVNYWTPNGANIYYNSGNVGIGDNNPATKLFIKTTTGNFGLTHTDGSIWISTYIGSDAASDAPGGWIGTETNHPLYLYANAGLPKLSVLQNGNVGIGTTLPDARLSIFSNQVAGNDNTYLLTLHGRNPVLTFTDENNVSVGYIKSWTHSPYAPFTNSLVVGSAPGYPIYLSTNNYSASMTVGDNGDVGIGTTLPDARLSLFSSVVQSNDNTYLLGLHGRNPIVSFTDENNVAIGYIKSWTHNAYAPFTNGMLIGSAPGYPIFFSTNYGLSMIIANNGNVGIGTANPTYKLSVNGNVRSKEVVVESGWADFVFDEKYDLPKLDAIEQYISQHRHLPGIPSAGEIQKNGLSIGGMQSKMMQKIEELTLYVIELQKQIDQLKKGKDEAR